MKITWYGHSCFIFEDSKGNKVLTDPFDNSLGYTFPKERVDIVTISHHHFDHDNTTSLEGNPEIIDTLGEFNLGKIRIKGLSSFHDKEFGARRGANVIYIFNIDGFTICHLGDLGHTLDDKFIKEMGPIDILLIPVGGNYTIDGFEAAEIAHKIKSHIIIPMHFGTHALTFPLDGAEKFILQMKNADRLESSTLIIDKILNEFDCVKLLRYQ